MAASVLEHVEPRWRGECCIVAAPGPSLTLEVAEACRGDRVIAVNDAYRRLPFADVLYACDARWWGVHGHCAGFAGEKWSSHSRDNQKLKEADRYGLTLVTGCNRKGFSLDPDQIHYGGNSGFQAVNLAILFGAYRIVLIGCDMHGSHFFGPHPTPLRNTSRFDQYIQKFGDAAKMLPSHIKIVNATPDSALMCFPFVDFISARVAA
jgi:hypothetical protein